MSKTRQGVYLTVVVLGAVALKVALLVLGAMPFNADEAVVALMARHILQGARPWLFYGQAYMGSLDAYLVAGAFRLMGQSVLAVRVVQVLLFVATLLVNYGLVVRLTGRVRTALVSVSLMAFPPVLLTLYTTVSLGGYGEALLAGSLLLWWGHRLVHESRSNWGLWAAWGFVAGVGFWALGLVLVYLVPTALWLVWRLRAKLWPGYVLAMAGFALGSLPWFLGNSGRMMAAAGEVSGTFLSSTATGEGFLADVGSRMFSFIVFGLPVLFGLRFPWTVEGPPLLLAVPVLALYLAAIVHGLRGSMIARSDRLLLWGMCVTLFLGFVLTPFGGDPSGRYFLPLYLPLFTFAADALAVLKRRVGNWAWIVLGSVIVFNIVGTVQAALNSPPGITTQFEAITQVDHGYDDELIRFLRAHGGTRGYANYWVVYPIAFLSDEQIILVPRLPYKADLRYTARDDRYAPYGEQVAASPEVVYVTTNHPELDTLIGERFLALGVGFREKQIGSYHVFYDLERKVVPDELDLWSTVE